MTEEILAGIWEAVLKQDEVSVKANFFDLGGHSLLGAQLIARGVYVKHVLEQVKIGGANATIFSADRTVRAEDQ